MPMKTKILIFGAGAWGMRGAGGVVALERVSLFWAKLTISWRGVLMSAGKMGDVVRKLDFGRSSVLFF